MVFMPTKFYGKIMSFTREQIEVAMKKLGHAYFENGDYNVNIIGIRNSSTGKRVTNLFDDWMTIAYKENGVWKFHIWPCTVDNGAGSGRLVEGQYRGSFTLGLHQGKYEALKQCKPLRVYRDWNLKDGTYDESKIYTDVAGLNIHMAGVDSQQVNNWSEACQVFKRSADYHVFMPIVKKAVPLHGKLFTYTLIGSKDITNLLD
jgi:hypothetical protein